MYIIMNNIIKQFFITYNFAEYFNTVKVILVPT